MLKEITKFDLPGSYKSNYLNDGYTPIVDAHNLKVVIDKVNEVIRYINLHNETINKILDSRVF